MIDPDMRNAVFRLHQEGMSLREISRRLHVSRNAVRAIVRQQGKIIRKERRTRYRSTPSCSSVCTTSATAGSSVCTRSWSRNTEFRSAIPR